MPSSNPSFNVVALTGLHTDPKVGNTMLALAEYLAARGRRVVVEPSVDLPLKSAVQRMAAAEFTAHSDLIIAVGGDGTMLHAAKLAAGTQVPVLGINRGRLGFLADVGPDEMQQQLDRILGGDYVRGSRPLLQTKLISTTEPERQALSINDMVVQKWETGRMLYYETWINGQYVNTHGGDGVIVATATGSTAYALSCGGPIIQPELDALVIAPICPHTLSDRPIVIQASSTVEIRRVRDRATKAQVTCDGHILGDLNPQDRLVIGLADVRVNLLHPHDHDYYRILRSKLHWGRGVMEASRYADDEE